MATTTGSKRLLNISSEAMAASNSMTYGGLNVATEQFVSTQVSNLISSAPGALDTLNELAAAIGDDSNFATTVTNSIATKLDASVNPLKAASVSNDTITFTRADNTTFAITTSDANTDTNYYLNGITRSGNTLTFSVSGTTNRTYTFGSAAWSATSAFDGAGSADAVNTRIDSEIIPLIDGKADASHTHAYLPLAGGTITGSLTVSGSQTRGTYTTLSQYHSGADNIVLKGNASGISSIFFESEKDGTNINHPSDFGFIQYHAYGTSTSGESNELIIGVSNDADDHVILNAPNVNGLKFRTGVSATDYTVYHSGNLSLATLGYTGAANANYITNNNQLTNGAGYLTTSGKAADSNLLDGIDSSGFVKQLGITTDPDFQTPSSRRLDPNTSNPTNDYYAVTTFGNGSNVTGQLATHFQNGQSYLRAYNSSWSGWRKIWDATNFNPASYLTTTGKAADSNLLDGLDSSSFVRSDATDTLSGHYTFSYNSGIIGSAQPGYTQGAIEIITSENNTPAIGFHRGGQSATALYEYDGQLYVNPWVTRAQEGLLLSSGNISAYADAAGAADAVNTRIDEDVLPAIPTNNNQLTNGAGYLTTSGKAADSELLDGLNSTAYMRDNGWNSNPGQDADTQPGMSSDFSYANNAPHTGDLIRFGSGNYSLQLSSAYNAQEGALSFRTRNGDAGSWNDWREVWHTGNFNPASYLTTGAKAADSNLLDGLDLHTGRNNQANKVVRTQGNGYVEFGWINTTSGNTTGTITDFYVNTGDGYIRKATLAHVKSQLGLGSAAYVAASTFESAGAADVVNSRIDDEVLPIIGDITLASLGFTGATNANYITNNNQLTNGAGYLTSSNDRVYITDSRGAARAPSYYNDRYAQWDFQNVSDTGVGGDGWHALLTVSKWSSYDNSHRQEQLIFSGEHLWRRTATSDSAWGANKKIWDSGNLDAFVGATVSNDTITFTQANGGTVAVTTSDANTNTWRPIDDTPVNGVTDQSISSNWAYDHVNASNPHGTTAADVGADAAGAADAVNTRIDEDVLPAIPTNNNQLTNGAGYITSYVNTTYTAGSGLQLSGTTFRLNGGEIPGGVDLNTYRTTGIYAQNSNADTTSGSNWPTNFAGILEVWNDDYGNGIHCTQRYSRYNTVDVYQRNYYNGTWTSWRNLTQDTNTTYSTSDFDAV